MMVDTWQQQLYSPKNHLIATLLQRRENGLVYARVTLVPSIAVLVWATLVRVYSYVPI